MQFSNYTDLVADIESKAGIYRIVAQVEADLPAPISTLNGFEIYDVFVVVSITEEDGQVHHRTEQQQILKDLSDNSFGYGTPLRWEGKNLPENFRVKLRKKARDMVENNASILGIRVMETDESSKQAEVAVDFDGNPVTRELHGVAEDSNGVLQSYKIKDMTL